MSGERCNISEHQFRCVYTMTLLFFLWQDSEAESFCSVSPIVSCMTGFLTAAGRARSSRREQVHLTWESRALCAALGTGLGLHLPQLTGVLSAFPLLSILGGPLSESDKGLQLSWGFLE